MLDPIAVTITQHGYAALLLAAIVEGPIATVIGAFLASQGLLDAVLVYAVAVAGDLIGDCICYGIGRSGWIALRRTSMGGSQQDGSKHRWRRFLTLARRLKTHAGRMLLFGKLTHSAGFLVLLTAGAVRIPVTAFLGYNLLGTLPKSALFMVIGYFFGTAYTEIDSYLAIASCLIFAAICLGAGMWLRKRLLLSEASIPEESHG